MILEFAARGGFLLVGTLFFNLCFLLLATQYSFGMQLLTNIMHTALAVYCQRGDIIPLTYNNSSLALLNPARQIHSLLLGGRFLLIGTLFF